MKQWKELFRTHILERGFDYYERGAVEALRKTENGYTATVSGSEDYEVEIEIRDERICDMFCDCPYATDGKYCKHMAAVLYEIEEGEPPETQPEKGWYEKSRESRKELINVINTIPEGKVRELLASLAMEDESLRNQILIKYSVKVNARQMLRLKKEIDEIAYRCSDRSGFVDYYHASEYIDSMNAFLYDKVQILIDKKCFMQAFELVNDVFHCVGNQDMDDSDGGTTWVANTCFEFWQQIFGKCGEAEKQEMFQWFMEHQTGYVLDYMEDYISDFLMDEFRDPELLLKKLKKLDELIEKAEKSTDCGSHYSIHSGFQNNILERLRIMERLGYSEEEMNAYRQKYRHFSAVRELEIQEYLERKEYDKAVLVLKESKKLDQAYPGLVSKYSEILIDIYKTTKKADEYKEELCYQIFFCVQNNLDYVNALKGMCSEEEWKAYREKILEAKTVWPIKCEFLVSEELYDRLMKEIAQNESIYVLDQYEKILKKKYPQGVRDMYITYVRKQAERVSERKHYKELMSYLKKIAGYPDGKAEAQELAKDWRVIYRRRPAMMDELRKAGF